jgi:hypothetical protein
MANFELISAKQAYSDLANGDALLVNGYDDPQKWEGTRVPQAVSFMEFNSNLGKLAKDGEIIFYCA